MELNPLNGRETADEKNCEYCGVSETEKPLVEISIDAPPVPKYQNDDSYGPFACQSHVAEVKKNNQCCSNPNFKVHTADADAHLVEIVECKNCSETFEFAPRPK